MRSRPLSHNPYSPPQAPVVDASVGGPARPRNVTLAVWSTWAAFIMSPLTSVHQAVALLGGAVVLFFTPSSTGWFQRRD